MRNLLIFLVVALLSYGAFTMINNALEPQSIAPTLQAPKEAPIVKKEPVIEIPEETIEIDTTIYQRNDAGYLDITWKMLSKVTFDEVYNDTMDQYIPYPIFSPEVKYLDGKKISVKGYVIPIEETGDEDILVLSGLPYSSCFFCGGAGPETVMDIKVKKRYKKSYKRDDFTTFQGKLRLNDKDLYYLNYILDDAELVE